ncbi:MAG: GDSL-type esterase/lipase family protein [Bacteroidota bacterium]
MRISLLCLICLLSLTQISAQVRILPLGNSITQGQKGHPSYRPILWQMLQDAGLEVDFVGSMQQPYLCEAEESPDFDPDHEGHWGYRTDQIIVHQGANNNCRAASESGSLYRWLKAYTPDIALIHLGTNDLFQRPYFHFDEVIEAILSNLQVVFETLQKDNPEIVIYLAQLIPTSMWQHQGAIEDFNAVLPDFVERMAGAGYQIKLVPMPLGFDPDRHTYDQVHPNPEGARLMADKWRDAIMGDFAHLSLHPLRCPGLHQIILSDHWRNAAEIQLLDQEFRLIQNFQAAEGRVELASVKRGIYFLRSGEMMEKVYVSGGE